MPRVLPLALLACLGLVACGSSQVPSQSSSPSPTTTPASGRADIGGYELAYERVGAGEPTVILEAGLVAAGTSEFIGFINQAARTARVCTYDRAGTGASDGRPTGEHVTAALMAEELHRLLDALEIQLLVVLVGHSYGGMPVRAFEGTYPDDVAGMVLIDVSSEPEVPVYERLDAGPWIDGTDRIDIHATVRELHAAGDLGDVPLLVVTAGIIEDQWLATVPKLAARAQVRLAGLSSNALQVVASDSGHFVHRDAPDVVLAAIEQVVEAVRSGSPLAACDEVFGSMVATCVARERGRSSCPRSRLGDGLDLEIRVPGDHVEVSIGVEDRDAFTDRDGGDEAVQRVPNRFPREPARPPHGGSAFVRHEVLDPQHREGEESNPRGAELPFGSGACEEFHHNRFRHGDLATGSQQVSQRQVNATSRAAELLDPGGGIGKDHRGSRLLAAGLAFGPSGTSSPQISRASSSVMSAHMPSSSSAAFHGSVIGAASWPRTAWRAKSIAERRVSRPNRSITCVTSDSSITTLVRTMRPTLPR